LEAQRRHRRVLLVSAALLVAVAGLSGWWVAGPGWGLETGFLSHVRGQAHSGTVRGEVSGTAGSPGRATSVPYAGDPSVFDYSGREKKLQIDRVMRLLGIGPGKTVADIGAGGGWFTVRAARKVGRGGTVIAEEINPAALTYIDRRAAKVGLTNVRTVLGTPDDPKLGSASVDAVMMLKMYHEIAHPLVVMERVQDALRPGARVGIIDRNGNGTGEDHGVPRRTVEREMTQAGFVEVGAYDFTKTDGEDYFLVFQKRK
jgi:SAM-dependent methyltransferase